MSVDSDILNELHAASILIVDDDPISRKFIEKTLRDRGFTQLFSVDSGVKALAQLQHFQPALVILDIYMTGLNGLDCCQWIRTQPRLRDLPVLMLTSLTDENLRLKAFEVGATDFVCKPLHPDELYGRVKIHLQSRLGLRELQIYKNRLALELQSARELQTAILPSAQDIEELATRCHVRMESHLTTSSEIGGDFWGMKQLFPHQVSLWMADFSGHGVAAALNAFRLQAYLKEHSELAARPGDYLSILNDKMLKLLPRGYFATMFYGIMDTRGNRLHYACACAPHPMILRKDGRVERLDGAGTPLGICMQFYPTRTVEFHSGDILLLYSDALTETPNEAGEFITEEAIMEVLSSLKEATGAQVKQTLLSVFSNHIATAPTDDLTLCICQRTEHNHA